MADSILQRLMYASVNAGCFRHRTVSVNLAGFGCEDVPLVVTHTFVIECEGGDEHGKVITLSSQEHRYTDQASYALAWYQAMTECLDALADWRYRTFGCGEGFDGKDFSRWTAGP